MSLAGLAMIRDEADLINGWLTWTLSQVDVLYVLDNLSEDGTSETLAEWAEENDRLVVIPDPEVAYEQSRKMSDLAARALADGHTWAAPIDADEILYAPDGRPVTDWLAGLGREVQIIWSDLFNHLPTAIDDMTEPNPFRRIGWRQRSHSPLPKVVFRLKPGAVIGMGNHSVWLPGTQTTVKGLVTRHFSWRTEDTYLRKIANGSRAYAATDLPDSTGAHWRMFGLPDDPDFEERVRGHFREWFFVENPVGDDTLIYDPAGPILDWAAG